MCGYSLLTHYLFDNNRNKHDFYRGDHSMKNIFANLKGHVTDLINCKKNRNFAYGKERRKIIQEKKFCHICKEEFNEELSEDRNYSKIRNHFHYTGKYRGAAHGIYNVRYKTPKEIPVVFQNCSNGRRT